MTSVYHIFLKLLRAAFFRCSAMVNKLQLPDPSLSPRLFSSGQSVYNFAPNSCSNYIRYQAILLAMPHSFFYGIAGRVAASSRISLLYFVLTSHIYAFYIKIYLKTPITKAIDIHMHYNLFYIHPIAFVPPANRLRTHQPIASETTTLIYFKIGSCILSP